MSEYSGGKIIPGKMVEPDAPAIGFLSRWFIVLSIFVVGTSLLLVFLFHKVVQRIIYKKSLSVPNNELLDIRKRDEARLTTYEIIDKDKGIYQIPIDVVIDQIVENPELLGPVK